MPTRKIQLIAGTTYTVSLPKQWVKKNNLKEKNEVSIEENSDGILYIHPKSIEENKLDEITLNIDEYMDIIDQVIFALYYLGISNITIFSKKELTKKALLKIRKNLTYMSGTEITYADKNKVSIKVLLDHTKINLPQVLYRMYLIIESSLVTLSGKLDMDELTFNEDEIDRLYHLLSKIISMSIRDPNMLRSSDINNIFATPFYFLVNKRFEDVADNIYNLSKYLKRTGMKCKLIKKLIPLIKRKMNRCVTYIIKKRAIFFKKTDQKKLNEINNIIQGIDDRICRNYFEGIVRYIIDIEEAIGNISLYNKLIKEKLI